MCQISNINLRIVHVLGQWSEDDARSPVGRKHGSRNQGVHRKLDTLIMILCDQPIKFALKLCRTGDPVFLKSLPPQEGLHSI